jgi:hypothetical protein
LFNFHDRKFHSIINPAWLTTLKINPSTRKNALRRHRWPTLSRPWAGVNGVFTPLVAPGWRAYYHPPVSSYGHFPTESELAMNGAAQAALHERAAAATRNKFGNKVFVRAVVEVSNFCRELRLLWHAPR